MDTLAVLLYTSSLPRRVRDFHPLERAHGAQTKKEPRNAGFLSQHQTNPYFKSKDFRLDFLPYLFAHFYPKNPLLLSIIIIQEIVILSIFLITNDGL